jgi:RNA polymerase subunit RPABC4/transcription elongation factor Spt4
LIGDHPRKTVPCPRERAGASPPFDTALPVRRAEARYERKPQNTPFRPPGHREKKELSAMLCPHCGKEIPEGSKVCPACGAAREGGETLCPVCGSAFEPVAVVEPVSEPEPLPVTSDIEEPEDAIE